LQKVVGTRNHFNRAKKNYAFLIINYPALPKAPLRSSAMNTSTTWFKAWLLFLECAMPLLGIVTGTLIKKIKTLALWDGNKLTKNFVYDLEGTPCEKVTKMEVCYYPQAVQEYFPNDSYLVE
jgi:hypothetical protein